jgi:protein associated with RNAse G/E
MNEDEPLSLGRIEVVVRKYDGTEHRRWHADLIRQSGSLIVLEGVFDGEIEHEMMGRITSGTRSVEYYWLDRCYNVFRLTEKEGTFRSFYCNIGTPAVLAEKVLTYVDLDIDVLVEPDFSYRVIDLDEFEANIVTLGYSQEVQSQARTALAELVTLIEERQFPFSVEVLSDSH